MNIKHFNAIGLCGVVIIAFALTMLVAVHTPMHSDDYSYALKGLSLDGVLKNYFSWSGRLVADYVSPSLLSLPFIAKAAINSGALIILLLIISFLPQGSVYNRIISFATCFLLYWLGNSSLGQTTFWIVGSANYLWTNLFLMLYIFLLIKKAPAYFLLPLALIAGCSNENTGFVPMAITLIEMIRHKGDGRFKVRMASLSLLIVGYLTMIMSPGNEVRSHYFGWWYSKDISVRLAEHLSIRIPEVASVFWIVLLCMVITLFSLLRDERSHDDKQNIKLKYSFAYLILSVATMLIMVASPTYPLRSGDGTLIFLLVSISYLINFSDLRKSSLFLLPMLIALIILFVPKYKWMYVAYEAASKQNEFRIGLINEQKEKGMQELTIPDFFFSRMSNVHDRFDEYHNSASYGRYYGVKRVYKTPSTFDYSVLSDAERKDVKKPVEGIGFLDKIYLTKDYSIVLFTDKPISIKKDSGCSLDVKFRRSYRKEDESYKYYPESMPMGDKFASMIKVNPSSLAYISFRKSCENDEGSWTEVNF